MELIIVITILAILATIAFISFQSFTKDARDTSKISEIANVVKVIAANEAKSSAPLATYIKGTPGDATVTNIQGSSATTQTGALNTDVLGLDSKYAGDYEIAVYDGLGVYQVRAKMENTAEKGEYFTSGTYSPRSGSLSGTVTGGETLTLESGIGLVKIGDMINGGEVTGISSDLKTITFSGTVTGGTYTYQESPSLFGGN